MNDAYRLCYSLPLIELMVSLVVTNTKWKRAVKRFNVHKNKLGTQIIIELLLIQASESYTLGTKEEHTL